MGDFNTKQAVMHDKLARMNYIVDGHNLIAKMGGLALSMADDEERLIELMQRYSQHERGKFEVYFDGAPVGQAGIRRYGRVRAHFVPASSTADDAIRSRLAALGKAAGSWAVVSSDRSIQAAAREAHARVIKAEDFAEMVEAALQPSSAESNNKTDKQLSQAEVDEWLTIFKSRKKSG